MRISASIGYAVTVTVSLSCVQERKAVTVSISYVQKTKACKSSKGIVGFEKHATLWISVSSFFKFEHSCMPCSIQIESGAQTVYANHLG